MPSPVCPVTLISLRKMNTCRLAQAGSKLDRINGNKNGESNLHKFLCPIRGRDARRKS
jgi:hypothetical protein